VDADGGLGHYASYRAVEVGCEIAREAGAAAVGVINSEHFGAAGAYALAAAEAGFVAFATTNSDSRVGLHGGAARFHGTNPLAFAAPVPRERPWLFDMATSSISMNRVLLHRTLGQELLPGVAADSEGVPTVDAGRADILIPVGGLDYGYKGAGLAGVAAVLSGALMGMTLDADFIAMYGSRDISTPRRMGHFFFIIDPERFAGAVVFGEAMKSYLASLRAVPARPGESVMAPGDREWAVADNRRRDGIPIDPETAAFLKLA
jgi:LDH2 family malate/lactate/ureidoglycolate dehydrogenase